MPANDIIDNRDQKLVDHVNCILGSTEAAKFAVGYLFLSGLEAVAGVTRQIGPGFLEGFRIIPVPGNAVAD